ncbi:UNKNOWN [Stylonychia lemnae]|uniref:Uncharacterized protein n=1 Tax=Stylonychia lemnae TaxID=5949 RepID=A0A078BAM9_STYLE|nr:UNKNOWN [Stylonychia lemnae]|eukprot:CDW91281.1 UNKNOWN [Stylonychia lemnae]
MKKRKKKLCEQTMTQIGSSKRLSQPMGSQGEQKPDQILQEFSITKICTEKMDDVNVDDYMGAVTDQKETQVVDQMQVDEEQSFVENVDEAAKEEAKEIDNAIKQKIESLQQLYEYQEEVVKNLQKVDQSGFRNEKISHYELIDSLLDAEEKVEKAIERAENLVSIYMTWDEKMNLMQELIQDCAQKLKQNIIDKSILKKEEVEVMKNGIKEAIMGYESILRKEMEEVDKVLLEELQTQARKLGYQAKTIQGEVLTTKKWIQPSRSNETLLGQTGDNLRIVQIRTAKKNIVQLYWRTYDKLPRTGYLSDLKSGSQ